MLLFEKAVDYGTDGLDEDSDIHPETPVLNVVGIELTAFIES
jgi:hypothetical protein